jgi:tetratricopeptide (TPR) repeat protein
MNTAGRAADAREVLERALQIRLKDYPEEHRLVAATQIEYGDTLSRLGLFEEAEPLLEEGLILLSDRADRRFRRANEALERFRLLSSQSESLVDPL